jgi:hypothetical protein
MRFLLIFAAALAISVTSSAKADTFGPQPFGFGFQPYGFYQPYGAAYGNSLRTPPYFALNPPVYYGARYARPYGLSPFAAPPMLGTPDSYRGSLRHDFLEPVEATPGPACNPYIHCRAKSATNGSVASVKKGEIQVNPFVVDAEAKDLVAKN